MSNSGVPAFCKPHSTARVGPDRRAAKNHLLSRSLVCSVCPLWPRRSRRGHLCASRTIQSAERRGCFYVAFTAPLPARYALPSPPIATGAHYGGFRLARAQVRRLFRPCGRPWRPSLRDFVESVAGVAMCGHFITPIAERHELIHATHAPRVLSAPLRSAVVCIIKIGNRRRLSIVRRVDRECTANNSRHLCEDLCRGTTHVLPPA